MTDLSPQTVKTMLNEGTIEHVNQTQEVGTVHAPIPENDGASRNLPIRALRCAGYCVQPAPGGNWPVMHVILLNESDASGPLKAAILKRRRGIVRVLKNGSGHRQVFASYARIKDQRCSRARER